MRFFNIAMDELEKNANIMFIDGIDEKHPIPHILENQIIKVLRDP